MKIYLTEPTRERHSKSHDSYLLAVTSTPEEGLSSTEADFRLEKDGLNEISEQKRGKLTKFLKYFTEPMPALIWVAVLIELIRLAPLNFSFLLSLQIANGLVWFYEDHSSSKAIEALRKSLAPKAKVKRDGRWKIIQAKYLVVGDKIFISSGDILPADCVLGPGECKFDQSMLTGEINPVVRGEGGKVFMGSICKSGEIEAFVCSVGKNTFFRTGTNFFLDMNQEGKFQKMLTKTAFILMVVSSIMVCIIMITLVYKGNVFLESLSFCAVLMMLSIPIAMRVVCITTLAVGAKAMNKKDAIVCRINSIEELAGMDTLFIGKSTFLTEEKQKIMTPVLVESENEEDIFLSAFLACRKEKDTQNSIDRSLTKHFLKKIQANHMIFDDEDFRPFSSKEKRTVSTVRNTVTGEIFEYCKGNPRVVLEITKRIDLEPLIERITNKLADLGYSSLGVAKTDSNSKWVFCGIIPLSSTISKSIRENIGKIKDLNVKLVLLTGDQLSVTKKLCAVVNFGDNIFSASVFNNDSSATHREVISSIILNIDGYSDVYPEHKFTLVKMVQKYNKKVGITGKSISDAAALNRADVGLAAYGASDAAKAASDIIYNKKGLDTVINSIKKARKIFRRSETYCIYRVSCSFQFLVFFFVNIVCISPSNFTCKGSSSCEHLPNTLALPVLSMVIIAMLNNGTIISIAYDTPKLTYHPSKWNLNFIFSLACILGSVIFFSSLIFILLELNHMNSNSPNRFLDYFGISTLSYGQVISGIFLKVSISSYLTIFSVRSKEFFIWSLPGKYLGITSLTSMLISTIISKYWKIYLTEKDSGSFASMSPISWEMILFIWAYDVVFFIFQDFVKVTLYKIHEFYRRPKKDQALDKLSLVDALTRERKKRLYEDNLL